MLIELVDYKIGKKVIEYFFFQDGIEKSIVVQTINKNIDYTDYSKATEIVKSMVKKSIDEKLKKEKEQLKTFKKRGRPKKVAGATLTKKKKESITIEKPRKVKILNDEELSDIVRDKIWYFKKKSKLDFVKESTEQFANRLFKVKENLNEQDFEKLRKVYFYYFNLDFKEKDVKRYLDNSEYIDLIKMVLLIY
jgi:hypothetical protein